MKYDDTKVYAFVCVCVCVWLFKNHSQPRIVSKDLIFA